MAKGAALRDALNARFGNHPHVGDIRGRGLFIGIELVRDRGDKSSFDPALKLHARIKKAAMAEGLICYPGGGTVDGTRGDHILLAPPFILNDGQVEELVGKLETAVASALEDLPEAGT